MTDPSSSRLQRLRRAVQRVAVFTVGVLAAWLALALHPEPLFAYTARRANVVVHARVPLPPEAGAILGDVLRRIARSPLYEPERVHHVFLCDTPALYGLFALDHYASGGVAHMQLTGNVFIRPADVRRNVVFGRSGVPKEPERSLAYFIAHELTHAMTADRLGRVASYRLSAFQREGYADYVAFARPVDLAAGRRALRSGEPRMSPARSGLYARYELLTAYLLERRGMSVAELLARPLRRRDVEAELLADPTL